MVSQRDGGSTVNRSDDSRTVFVINAGDRALNELSVLEVLAVGNHSVTSLDVSTGNFRQERLVGHVGQGIYEGDNATGLRDLLLQFECRVEADVAAANYQDARAC